MAAGSPDRVNVSGTANLAGAVQVQVQGATLGPWQQTVLSAAGGTTNNGLSLLASPALQAQLVFPNANDVASRAPASISDARPERQPDLARQRPQWRGGDRGPRRAVFNLLLNGATSLDGYRNVLNQLSGEGATGTQQVTFDAMNHFRGPLLDPFSRGTASTPGGGVERLRGRRRCQRLCLRRPQAHRRRARRLCDGHQGAAAKLRGALERVGRGLRRLADHRRQCRAGSNSTTSRIAAGRSAPTTVLAEHHRRFRAGRRRHQFRRRQRPRQRPLRPVPGRRLRAAYRWPRLHQRRAGLWLAGCHHQPHRDAGRPRPVAGTVQRQCLVGPARRRLSFCLALDAASASRPTRPLSSPPSTCRPMPSRPSSAPTISRWPMAPRTSPRRAANSASAPTNPGCRTLPDATLTLRSRFAWAHDYNTDRSIGATFQTLPGASFVVNGAAQVGRQGADHGVRRSQMAQRLLAVRHLRGRVLQQFQSAMPARPSRDTSGEGWGGVCCFSGSDI